MDIQAMRNYIFNAYSGKGWHQRVLTMPTNQVVAVYNSIKKREALPKEVKQELTPKEEPFHQMDIWEYLNSKEA